MHLVIYFCGTGNPGSSFYEHSTYLEQPNIKTIFVEGCDKPEVCGSGFFPDLKAFARRFTNKVFEKEEGDELVVNPYELETVGVNQDYTSKNLSQIDEDDPIESITLCGYSRGAVTCFEVAKELNKIAPYIPVDIVADQPVPGNCYQGPGTNAASVADCSNLRNLRNVSVILGAYTGTMYKDNAQNEEDMTNPIHRGFFSQIVPKLPHTANRDLIVIPRESHHQTLANSPDGSEHMHMQVARYLNQQDKQLVSDEAVKENTNRARGTYNQHENQGYQNPTLFPQQTKLQSFFGLSKKDAYLHIDKLHPKAGMRVGYDLGPEEKMIDWWTKHDKNTSRFSTKLTKALVQSIEKTDASDEMSLKKLFAEADKWLLLKADTSSSRYYQVEALRNNIYDRLTGNMAMDKSELATVNRSNLHDTNYFLNHWTVVSKAASYFKTKATLELDKAFSEHAQAKPSQENDQKLMTALDQWIENKKDSSSKRYDDVIKIKEQLTEVINNCYENKIEAEQQLKL
jgi:hypothetical protein